ncbi:MAG: CRISPR system precrRNA processing endoribonuclease RAMP protein Cas6 [Bacillota bacterium]
MTKKFLIAQYEVVIEAGDQGLSLPAYKGSTLRGGFGAAFRRIACSRREVRCRDCLLGTGCPYAYIFETAPPPGSEALRNYESVPRPFVLEPPLDTRIEYRPGERISFYLILIGRAAGYLPYFIVAFKELGEMGIGRGRKKYRLAEIRAVNPVNGEKRVIYRNEDQVVRNVNLAVETDIEKELKFSGKPLPGGSVSLELLTMTRIKYEDNFVHRLEFHMLVRSLLRRISSLACFHHGWELDLDFSGLIERAAEVRVVGDETRWVDWERYSSRQDGKMNLGGLVGRVTYQGQVSAFKPLLKLGELVHVGKGAVFGMGKYTILKGAEGIGKRSET